MSARPISGPSLARAIESTRLPVMSAPRLAHRRPDLNGACPCRGNARGHLDGLIQVFCVDEVEPAELFLRFCKRAVGGGDSILPDRFVVAFGVGCRASPRMYWPLFLIDSVKA